jgi:hypothetical protein
MSCRIPSFRSPSAAATAAAAPATSSKSSKAVDLDRYLGPALFSKKTLGSDINDRAGAGVRKDSVFIPQLGKTFDRYIFNPSSQEGMATHTLYRDDAGKFYSYYWDGGGLTHDFSDAGALFNEKTFVELENRNGELSGAFYAGDRPSEVELNFRFKNEGVQIDEKKWGILFGSLNIPVNTEYTYKTAS